MSVTSTDVMRAVVFAAAVLVYAVTWWGDFVYDDVTVVRDDPRQQSVTEWPRLWTEGYWNVPGGDVLANYRPVTSQSFAVAGLIGGAGTQHLVNTLLHGFVTLLVLSIGMEVLPGRGAALASALLFAVHPVHVEAVANIVGRAELLAALFALLAWRAHRRDRWGLAAASLALGLLSKESAITIVGVMLLDDWLGRPGARRPAVWSAWPWCAYAGLTGASLLLRRLVLGHVGLGDHVPSLALLNPLLHESTTLASRWATALHLLARQWLVSVWPAELAADHTWREIVPLRGFGDVRAALGLVACAGLAWLALASRRRRPAVTLGLGVWFVTGLLTSHLVVPVAMIFAERLLYLPSVGMCLVAGAVVADAAARAPGRWARWMPAAGVALLIPLSAHTVHRAWQWNDALRLWEHEVHGPSPRSSQAWGAYGAELQARGRFAEALEAFRRSAALSRMSERTEARPLNTRTLEALAGLLMKEAEAALRAGRAAQGLALLAEADRAIADFLALDEGNAVVWSYRGIRCGQEGRVEEGEEAFRRALALDATSLTVLQNLSVFLDLTDRRVESLEPLRRAADLYPMSPEPHESLAATLEALGSPEAAARHRAVAAQLRPPVR